MKIGDRRRKVGCENRVCLVVQISGIEMRHPTYQIYKCKALLKSYKGRMDEATLLGTGEGWSRGMHSGKRSFTFLWVVEISAILASGMIFNLGWLDSWNQFHLYTFSTANQAPHRVPKLLSKGERLLAFEPQTLALDHNTFHHLALGIHGPV